MFNGMEVPLLCYGSRCCELNIRCDVFRGSDMRFVCLRVTLSVCTFANE